MLDIWLSEREIKVLNGDYMNNELFEKRILFESLSQIMENQKKIMRHLGITKYNSDWGYDDDYTMEVIEQCDGIVNRIRWEEKE